MASNIFLISSGANYYLSGLGTPYTGTGAPWTAQATSPYQIAMNDVGGRWTPQAAPVRNGDDVAESLTIQAYATGHDRRVFLKQQLSKILNTAQFSGPCILAVQPDGSTNIAYAEIYSADCQEDERFINDEVGSNLIRIKVTWRRSAFFGTLATGESVFSSRTFTNTGTGSNNNTQAFPAAPSGDLIYDGQPMNLFITPVSSGIAAKFFLASVLSRTYDTSMAGAYSTASMSGLDVATDTIDISSVITNHALKPRILIRYSASHPKLETRIVLDVAGVVFYTSPWIAPGSLSAIVDYGSWPIDIFRAIAQMTSAQMLMTLWFRSTDGTSVSGTVSYHEVLLYYDFAHVLYPAGATLTTQKLVMSQYTEQSGRPCLPLPTPTAIDQITASGNIDEIRVIRGTPPRLWDGASLYLAWHRADASHNTTDTVSVTARQAALWRSLRGAD